MTDPNDLRQTMPDNAPPTRRARRAARTRARALSPRRIVLLLMSLPVITCSVALSVYLRTSPYDPAQALRHLAALHGCDTARVMGLAPARRGQPGYHARNDSDRDGIACEPLLASATNPREAPGPKSQRRMQGGAKFIRP